MRELMEVDSVRAWHFLPADRRLRYGDGRLVIDGETLSVAPDVTPRLCEAGMHASERLTDALGFAPGGVLCRVVVSGGIVRGSDKLTGQSRRVEWSIGEAVVLGVIVAYARWCADRANGHAAAARAAAYARYAADAYAAVRAARATDAAALADAAAARAARAAAADARAAAVAASDAAADARAAAHADAYAADAAAARADAVAAERRAQEAWWLSALTPHIPVGCTP